MHFIWPNNLKLIGNRKLFFSLHFAAPSNLLTYHHVPYLQTISKWNQGLPGCTNAPHPTQNRNLKKNTDFEDTIT